MYQPLNQYHVVMEVAPQFQQTTEALQNIYLRSSSGAPIPLAAFTHFTPSNMPLAVNHQSQFPSVTISFNLAPGISLGQATIAINNAQQSIGFPATIQASFQGTAAAFQDSLSSQKILIFAALVTVYIVLGMLYESYIHPITILSTIPSAGVGALLALLLTHNELNVIGMIGIILLIGLVKKNAIMMIDVALEVERTQGRKPAEAIYEACLLRFRPIMMTTMAALLGGLPLALGHGTGSEMHRPLGITIVGGLIVSQALTLFTTPVVYVYLDRLRMALRGGEDSLVNASPDAPTPSPAH
jgi:multidrug efflux pump subunit AcrB